MPDWRETAFGRLPCGSCGAPRREHPPGDAGPRCPEAGPIPFDHAGVDRWTNEGGR